MLFYCSLKSCQISRHRILDKHFITYICCKNCNVCLKRPKNKRKRGRGWPIFKKQLTYRVLNSILDVFGYIYLMQRFDQNSLEIILHFERTGLWKRISLLVNWLIMLPAEKNMFACTIAYLSGQLSPLALATKVLLERGGLNIV